MDLIITLLVICRPSLPLTYIFILFFPSKSYMNVLFYCTYMIYICSIMTSVLIVSWYLGDHHEKFFTCCKSIQRLLYQRIISFYWKTCLSSLIGVLVAGSYLFGPPNLYTLHVVCRLQIIVRNDSFSGAMGVKCVHCILFPALWDSPHSQVPISALLAQSLEHELLVLRRFLIEDSFANNL